MDIFLGVIVGLIVLMLLVTLHEFGHFMMARRNGVRVLEFGIGFPPKAVAWIKDKKTHKWRRLKRAEWQDEGLMKVVLSDEKNTTKTVKMQPNVVKKHEKLLEDGLVFSLNWLPIGGFCQMDGESAADTRKGTFGAASFWSKTKILFGGVMMNWLTAWVILTILAWTGMPVFLDGQFTLENDTRVKNAAVEIVEVVKGSPAEVAGFKAGDKILAVGGEEIYYASDISKYNSEHAGEEVSYTVEKCDESCETTEVTAKLNDAEAEYKLGIAMESSQALRYSTWSAPIVGAGLTLQMTGETFKGLGQLVWNLISGVGMQFSGDATVRETGQAALSSVGDSVSGPVGILGSLFPAFASTGPTNLAFLSAIISISLACMNVLPIPALDGGRWLLIAIYKIRKKKLTKETEERIVSRAMMVLLALIAIVTILDITRFFR